MAEFLVRSLTDPRGYVPLTGDALPRIKAGKFVKGESYVPWAMLGDKVVYAETGMHNSWRGGNGLRPYDITVSQSRRTECRSDLGIYALRSPIYTAAAVNVVSSGVKKFLLKSFFTNTEATIKTVYDQIGHYFFTTDHGFGRLADQPKTAFQPKDVFSAITGDALSTGRLEQKLAIHDAVGRKLIDKLAVPGPIAAYNELAGGKDPVRQKWFDDAAIRGPRASHRRVVAGPTALGGTRSAPTGANQMIDQARKRGVDQFTRDLNRQQHKQANDYYDDLDTRTLLFGAGISGTTGTLLQAARAFGGIRGGEMAKQYTFAIIGYLVGVGMHSYHESMVIAQKTGVPYRPGAFIDSLPATFLGSHDFKRWSERYYDIVYLGAIHWRYNAGVKPSHLNTQLKPPPLLRM